MAEQCKVKIAVDTHFPSKSDIFLFVMYEFQKRFIELAVDVNALKFGEFELKSGRVSPYFFNAGLFNTGASLNKLGQCYAEKILSMDDSFDMLFGPAYKGIPLVSATAVALAEKHGKDIPYAFNRKEAKQHGEGGSIVGAELSGKILILDDVITAGTAIRESLSLIDQIEGAEVAGVIVGLDRQEVGPNKESAIQTLRSSRNMAVEAIVQLDDLIEYLSENSPKMRAGSQSDLLNSMYAYKEKYGC